MKFSEAWLREWVNPSITTDQLVAQLTMAGLEVDAAQPAAGQFSGVIVGEILSAEPHPNAEKLRVCQVKGLAEGVQQVVCGAANARPGIKVPFATVGAQLPEMTIKKAALRGVESAGMLCAQTELQAGEDDSGLWELPADAPVGTDLRVYLQLDDALIEVDLTPNRGDCLSIRGMAREVGVLNQCPVREQVMAPVPPVCDATFPVVLHAPEACPSYVGRVLRNIDIGRPTPNWMKEKLRRSGIRSIDPVVDVTNFVMLELGQPMHAFDLDKLTGGIEVRLARPGEMLKLLNDQEIPLTGESLVIADAKGPLALAGIMGGRSSGVGPSTRAIFLESAFFAPAAIAGKARAYGLHTDSSHRFERGVDWDLQATAVERATQLLLEIVGGEPGPLVAVRVDQQAPSHLSVRLRKQRLLSGLGLDAGQVDAVALLQRLGLMLLDEAPDAWTFRIPSHRFDISIEEDLLEEVARVYGYNRLPTRPMLLSTELDSQPENRTPVALVKNHLVSRGYQEVITYSFIDPQLHALLYPEVAAVILKNPISADMASMRTSLVPGLLQTLRHNLNRQQTQARLFEVGMVFKGDTNPAVTEQQTYAAGLIYGGVHQPNWAEKSREPDFFDIKGDLESLLASATQGRSVEFSACSDLGILHPGQAANVLLDGRLVGYIGTLHPNKQRALDLPKPVLVFEILLQELVSSRLPKFAPLSRYPEVGRDLAVVVDKLHCVADLERSIRKAAGDVLKNLKLFDVYSGEGIDTKRKSLAFSLTFQHASRTLKDEEVNASMAAVVHCLEEKFGANLR
jgi:phenylalanyl-tRNA synthetase beta chain